MRLSGVAFGTAAEYSAPVIDGCDMRRLGEEQPAFDEQANQGGQSSGSRRDRGHDAEGGEECEERGESEGECGGDAAQLHRMLASDLIAHLLQDIVLGEVRAVERARRAE